MLFITYNNIYIYIHCNWWLMILAASATAKGKAMARKFQVPQCWMMPLVHGLTKKKLPWLGPGYARMAATRTWYDISETISHMGPTQTNGVLTWTRTGWSLDLNCSVAKWQMSSALDNWTGPPASDKCDHCIQLLLYVVSDLFAAHAKFVLTPVRQKSGDGGNSAPCGFCWSVWTLTLGSCHA